MEKAFKDPAGLYVSEDAKLKKIAPENLKLVTWDEAFFFVYTYSLLNFFYLTVSDVIP